MLCVARTQQKSVVKHRPGSVRDAIVQVLTENPEGASIKEIEFQVAQRIGSVPSSSIRSYLRLNTPELFVRMERAQYALNFEEATQAAKRAEPAPARFRSRTFGGSVLVHADCGIWLKAQAADSIHAVVTDPPYGLVEYSPEQQEKLRNGKGGIWRIPPSFDGAKRSPLPRFTVLTPDDLRSLEEFFFSWGRALIPILVPGANVVIASNPLLSHVVSSAIARAGFERRGEIIRLVMTMRGGDRPKAAHEEFPDISVMPRSMWEPWLVFRKPIEGRVQDNLRKWKTGGFRRPSADKPFGDVMQSGPARKAERVLAPHPSLKPQAFLRQLVRAVLPLGDGVVLDPFAGSGSTIAAAEAVGYRSIGIEKDVRYF
ncbi:MAG: site-specific DNA-methyltransferase, partial [Betaproteobacteria bacterium]|nr:site-specific DNA-methyltransferase [Betaproteobacteria bacterium]